MEKVDIAIIGAGVVGLAIAYELSTKTDKSVVVLEKHDSFGRETSSRNSQVIHSGIYNPSYMLKTKLCIEGRQRLYNLCHQHRIRHKKLGKLVVACDPDDSLRLHNLWQQAGANQLEAQFISAREVRMLEPAIQVTEALFVPDSGIVDVHHLMQTLYYLSRENQAIFAFHSELNSIEYTGQDYILQTNRDTFKAEWVVNSAGLGSDNITALLGLDVDKIGYRIFPCKGEYYFLRKPLPIRHLVYPLPGKSGVLGIHVTPDMGGALRLGPNAYDVGTIDYDIDNRYQEAFFQAVSRFLPGLQPVDIAPDFAGIRPRLQRLTDPLQDFIINEESAKGFPHFINLVGIESPGLTSCLAIAAYVSSLM